MIFNIKPYHSVGNIELGMTRDNIRDILGTTYKSFKRNQFDEMPCDHFDALGFFVYYKTSGTVEALEFYPPVKLFFKEKSLFDLSYSELKEFLLQKDPDLDIEEDYSLTSYKLGIGVYTPNADEDPSLPVESIIVFEKNYYEC